VALDDAVREGCGGLDASILMHRGSGKPAAIPALQRPDGRLPADRNGSGPTRSSRQQPARPPSTPAPHEGGEQGVQGRFSVLVPPASRPKARGKPPGTSTSSASLDNPTRPGERTEPVENSTRYNPENAPPHRPRRSISCSRPPSARSRAPTTSPTCARRRRRRSSFQFKNVLRGVAQKVPFGICQVGKAFATINPRNSPSAPASSSRWNSTYFIRRMKWWRKWPGRWQV